MMDACPVAIEPAAPDFYDGLAALLRVGERLERYPDAPLRACLPRLQGYLQVALKHLPDVGGADYVQAGVAAQWRAGGLLRRAAPVSARWLRTQLAAECAALSGHAGFDDLRALWPADAAVLSVLAGGTATGD